VAIFLFDEVDTNLSFHRNEAKFIETFHQHCCVSWTDSTGEWSKIYWFKYIL